MMNVIEVQDALKGMPMEQLIREVQMPSGQVPQFLVLSEITRRREMEKAYAQNQGQPQTTVAQDAVAASGVPQAGIAGISRAMAPNTDMAQNTGAMPQAPVQQMASGGYVQKMNQGGRMSTPPIQFMTDPSVREMASRQGVSIEEFWNALSDDAKERQLRTYADTQTAAPARMPSISDVPTLPRAPVMFGGFSMPSEPVPQRPVLGIQGYAREPSAYTPRGMGIDALSNIQNMAPNTVEGRQADYAARMAGEGAVAARSALGERALAGRVGMDTSEAAAQMNAQLPPASVELLQPPSLAQVMEQYGFTAEEAQQFIDNNPAYRGARYGGEGSSVVVPEAAPPGTTDAIPMRPIPFYPFVGSQEEYNAAVAEWERKRAAIEAERARIAAENQEPEVLEGGEFPAGTVVAPPLPPKRGVVPPTTPPAPPAPPAGGGAGAGIAGAMSPFESEIANLLQQREKRAEQDKWLALAQVGLSLMGSRQPTFAGALGEAGAAGLAQFQQNRAQYDKDRLELLALQESTRLNRAKLAAAGQGKGLTPYQAATLARQMRSDAVSELSDLEARQARLEDPMGNPPTDERLERWQELEVAIKSLENELYGISGGDTGGEDFATSAARAS